MSFTIDVTGLAGALSTDCSTASDAMNKVLELEQHPHGKITVKDSGGRKINFDELTALCEAGEDSSVSE
jgi:hypothetical protein